MRRRHVLNGGAAVWYPERVRAQQSERIAQEPKQDRKVIHLTEITCKMFTELTQQEQGIIIAWLQGYYLPEHEPAAIDVEKLLSDRAKLTEHCINEPED